MGASESRKVINPSGPHMLTKSIPSMTLNTVNIKHFVTSKKTPLSPPSPIKVQIPGADEGSGPSSPQPGQIPNFGIVATGIYRSAFPFASNLEHLKALRLKTLVTLVTTPFDEPTITFLRDSTIKHYRITIPAHKNGKSIEVEDTAQVLRIITNPCNHPVLVHCNKGKHRTGCVVAAFRLFAAHNDRKDWAPSTGDILSEYRQYSAPKNRALDEDFIANFAPRRILYALAELAEPVMPIDYTVSTRAVECYETSPPSFPPTPPDTIPATSGRVSPDHHWDDYRAHIPQRYYDSFECEASPVGSECQMWDADLCPFQKEHERAAMREAGCELL